MGCWNGTCMVSQLPIMPGEPTRLFILVRQDYGELGGCGFSYHYEIFHPVAYSIRGTYDDYGSIDNVIENESTELVLNYFKGMAAEGKLINSDKKSKVKEDKIDLEYILNNVSRGNLYHMMPNELERYMQEELAKEKDPERKVEMRKDMGSYSKKEKGVYAAVMIKENVYQLAISTLLKSKNRSDKFCSDVIDEHIKKFLVHTNDPENRDLPIAFSRLNRLFSGFSDEHENMNSWYGELLFRLTNPNEVVEDRENKILSVVANTKEYMAFSWFLSSTRRSWMPQSGAGSQHGYGDEYAIYNDFYTGLADLTNKKMEEYKQEMTNEN